MSAVWLGLDDSGEEFVPQWAADLRVANACLRHKILLASNNAGRSAVALPRWVGIETA